MAIIVASDDSRDTRTVSHGLLGMHLEWQEDGKKVLVHWFSGYVLKCSTALWVAAIYK
jgi:hypothetical protein